MRTLLVYAALIGGLRFTGKRQLGELSTSEFAVTILVSELASVPLQDPAIPLLGGIVPLVTLLAVEVLLSCLCRRSIRFRRLLCGNPCMVIRDGKFDPDMLRLLRLSPEDVLEGLRMAGVALVSDVRCGIIETNGSSASCPMQTSSRSRRPTSASTPKMPAWRACSSSRAKSAAAFCASSARMRRGCCAHAAPAVSMHRRMYSC